MTMTLSVLSLPSFQDSFLSLRCAPELPRGLVRETLEVVALARRFKEDVAGPLAVELDRRTLDDPDYLPWDLVEEANRRRFYSLWVPRLFGGQGRNLPSMSCFSEEVASACTGIANVIGVHYLGVAGLTAGANPALANRILREVVAGERSGKPCLIALAITEPLAGTDVEDVDLLERGQVGCHAKRVHGGYRVSGTKVFISMGHVSTWFVLYAYTDLRRPADTTVGLVVKAGTPGFSLGRHEDKMGQRVCPASVLLFEDCFIPDDQVLFDAQAVGRAVHKRPRDVAQGYVDYVVSATRPGVCAFAAGAARGALERALAYAEQTKVGGSPLLAYEWVQGLLAEMYQNCLLGRLAYMEANYANSYRGLYRLLQSRPVYFWNRMAPRLWFDALAAPLLHTFPVRQAAVRFLYGGQGREDRCCCSGWASLAKTAGTDLAMRNSQLALELMGQTGLRQEGGAEKVLRDAKLLQIYEGTNQLNRLNLFKCLIRHTGELPLPSPSGDPIPWSPGSFPGAVPGDLSGLENLATSFAAKELLGSAAAAERGPSDRLRGHVLDKARQAGFWEVFLPEAQGGAGLTALCLLLERLCQADASLGGILFTNALAQALVMAAEGEEGVSGLRGILTAFSSYANPDVTTDFPEASPSGDAYSLTGRVDLLVLGDLAIRAVIPARVPGGAGYSLFLVDSADPGMRKSPPVLTLGLAACPAVDATLAEVRGRLLGERDQGRRYLHSVWGPMHAAAGAMNAGIMRGACQAALDYARTRRQGGQRILDWGEVGMVLAGMLAKTDAAALAVSSACRCLEEGRPDGCRQAVGAALQVHELACGVVDDGVQVLGGYGYMRDYGQERRFRDARQVQALLGAAPLRKLALLGALP